jgi:dimethylglycine dehydrogenase
LRQQAAGVPNHFVTLEVHDVTDADALGNEPLFDSQGAMVGRATAGGYGHAIRRSLAIGYVKPSCSAPGTKLQILILGKRYAATVVAESPYDPDNVQLRS